MAENHVTIIGGGLAGAEAAYQAATHGARVRLYEMRPEVATPMHRTGLLAELTGGSSFGLDRPDRATGLLIAELRRLGSLIIQAADATRLMDSSLLTVDRLAFAEYVTERIQQHPDIELCRQAGDTVALTGPAVIATGPMTAAALARSLFRVTGQEYCFFYGATEPLIEAASLDAEATWLQARFDEDQPAYRNCALTEQQFERFLAVLEKAGSGLPEGLSSDDILNQYLPLEVAAAEGDRPLSAGPLNPAGLRPPGSDQQPFGVCQLCPDDAEHSVYRAVNLRTGLPPPEQQRLFSNVAGLERAEFVRHGGLHRAVYINSPALLQPTYELRRRPGLLLAGAIAGVVGYAAVAASGWLAGINALRRLQDQEPVMLPAEALCGAMTRVLVTAAPESFRPLAVNFGMLPADAIAGDIPKEQRRAAQAEQAFAALDDFMEHNKLKPAEL